MNQTTSPIIHIATPDGRQSTHSEDEVRRLRQQGLITATTLFWQPGMSEWRPLGDFLAPAFGEFGTPPPLPPAGSRNYYIFTKDPSGLTGFLKVMLWIGVGMSVISLFSDVLQLQLVSSGALTPEAAEANDARQGIIGIIQLLTYLVTAVAFLMWIYRANLNARGFGATNMEFTPGWSVGYYFIPFVNLVRPYQAMKEIWKVSSDPQRWQTQSGSALLKWWWTLWLLASFLGNISFRLTMRAEDPSSVEAATFASICSGVVDIPLTLVAIALVSTIYRMQKDLVERGL